MFRPPPFSGHGGFLSLFLLEAVPQLDHDHQAHAQGGAHDHNLAGQSLTELFQATETPAMRTMMAKSRRMP